MLPIGNPSRTSEHALATLSFSNSASPFVAGTNVPSTKPSLRSSPPASLRCSDKVKRGFSIIPERTQLWKRRWAVWYGPYQSGRSCHGAPTPLAVPSGLSKIVAVTAGKNHSVALAAGGPPFICSPLVDRTVLIGSSASLRVAATGGWPLSYQWQWNGTNILGATQAVLTVNNIALRQAGTYSVLVGNASGFVTSPGALISLAPFAITNEPRLQSTFLGGTAQFQVGATGLAPFRYQWQFNGTDLPGKTSSLLVLTNVQLIQSGAYAVKLSNSYGATTSSNATLFVGQLAEWGDNMYSQTNVPPGLINIKEVACGQTHTIALRNDGTIAAWGASVTNVPLSATNIIQIAAGGSHDVVLRADGTVVAWGNNFSGQTNVPANLTKAVSVLCSFRGQPRVARGWKCRSLGSRPLWPN